MKVMVIQIKHYLLKNVLIKLDHAWKVLKIISKNLIQLTLGTNFCPQWILTKSV